MAAGRNGLSNFSLTTFLSQASSKFYSSGRGELEPMIENLETNKTPVRQNLRQNLKFGQDRLGTAVTSTVSGGDGDDRRPRSDGDTAHSYVHDTVTE
jgi:hypothetical protein